MAKVISQETFDDVVQENIVEFSMTGDEAKKETIEQFEAQGINLANIIKDLSINEETGRPVISETIEKLSDLSKKANAADTDETIALLEILADECAKTVPHRVMAAKGGALEILYALLEYSLKDEHDSNSTVTKKSVNAWNELINKQPDIFDDRALSIVIHVLQKTSDSELICGVLNLLKHATLLHEFNRQNIMNAEIMKSLQPLLKTNNAEVLRETCAVFRHLILDDDIRVEFSKAHEHARAIAADVLTELTELLPVHSKNQTILSELILTIASLTVRHEFCVVVEESGGLKFILNAMKEHCDSIRLTREALKLIRALAGNDSVKANIVKEGAAELINSVLNIHKENEVFAKVGLVCVSTLTLRSKDNSEALFNVGAAETIIETMRLHPDSKIVQRNGSWAIRNMVSRSRDQCPTFLTHGAECILQEAMEKHPEILQDVKAALRDLGCNVALKEEWTGTSKIRITN